jgi:RNA polymerase primary sigma factor
LDNKNTELKKIIFSLLNTLPMREHKVIEYRFFNILTLNEIAIIFNVTKERIRQIEAKALRRLRHPTRSRKLYKYIEII